MPAITAVIVTHNRLSLLKEAIQAVREQTYAIKQLIVVDNSSTDGTAKWLAGETDLIVRVQPNEGGSGGFSTGINMACETGAEYIWVMDDDTICRPDTLERLVEKLTIPGEPIGFVGSKSIWTDGSPHLMNLPAIKPSFNDRVPFNRFDGQGLLLIETSSFVSLLLNTVAVKAVGLPYREFFIWGDDQEYTRRITKSGYLGFYCADSVVLHKTPVNYFPDFYRDTPANLWKHHHGFRNEFFMVKKTKGLSYFLAWLPIKVLYTTYRLFRSRDRDRFRFARTLWSSARKSLFFNPPIRHVQ